MITVPAIYSLGQGRDLRRLVRLVRNSGRSPAIVALVATTVFASASAQAGELKWDYGNGGYVEVYGAFHPAIISVDDGEDEQTKLLDNSLATSRVGVNAVHPSGDSTFRFRFETALSLPTATQVNQNQTFYEGWDREDIRHFDFSFEGDWGKIWMGQGGMASDGAAESDLSYVSTTLYSFTADENAIYIFRDMAGGLANNPVIAESAGTFDGGRRTRIRYDTPNYNGFSARVAWGKNALSYDDEDTYYDLGIFYENELASGTAVSASVAYAVRERDRPGNRNDLFASASILFANGLSLTAATGRRNEDKAQDAEPTYFYAKVAYEADWFSFGKTGIGIDYFNGQDFRSDGSDSEALGIAIVQKVASVNADVYLKYRSHDFDENTASYQKVETVVLGAFFKF